jgi:phosphatidylinositol kinase/protein kinase (PI-3  family)
LPYQHWGRSILVVNIFFNPPSQIAVLMRAKGHVLNEFVRNAALPYLEDDHAEVRRAAALTCCRLFVRDPICFQASSHAIEIISDVLDKLLTVGIADPGDPFSDDHHG